MTLLLFALEKASSEIHTSEQRREEKALSLACLLYLAGMYRRTTFLGIVWASVVTHDMNA